MHIADAIKLYSIPNKIRYGKNGDGGYVVADLDIEYDCYISAGIANEESFTRDFLEAHSYIGRDNSYAYDGTIDDYPWEYTKEIQFVKKNIGVLNDDKHTNLIHLTEKYNDIFLNIDIEGYEFLWLDTLTSEQLKSFKQITIEFHGLNEDNWNIDKPIFNLSKKIEMIDKLNKTHYLIHAHGNNYTGFQEILYEKDFEIHGLWIPNVIEFTFISKDCLDSEPELNINPLPIEGLDYPNWEGMMDLPLFTYPFINNL